MNPFDAYFDPLIKKYPVLEVIRDDLLLAYQKITESFHQGRRLYICGNGGSAADAEHIISELLQPYKMDRPISKDIIEKIKTKFPSETDYFKRYLKEALPCLSLAAGSGFCTAYSNDFTFDMVFAQQIFAYGEPGDILLGITTSGQSKNVINAAKIADVMGLIVILLTSDDAVSPSGLNCILIRAPIKGDPCAAQELHLPIYHALCGMLEQEFFG
jgi:D-sedoheptulose 7-phosphate isomerase